MKINHHSEKVLFAPGNASSWSEMSGLAKSLQDRVDVIFLVGNDINTEKYVKEAMENQFDLIDVRGVKLTTIRSQQIEQQPFIYKIKKYN